MSGGVTGQKDDGYREQLLYLCRSRLTSSLWLMSLKWLKAAPVAVFFPEQEVTMNESVRRELYLYV